MRCGSTLLLLVLATSVQLSVGYWPFDIFGFGWNLVTDEATAPVIRMTFTQNRTFTSGITGVTYGLPDQVEMMDYSSSSLVKTVDIIRNISEYQHAAISWHNFGISFFGFFGFEFSKEAGDIEILLEDGNAVVYIAYKQFQFIEMATWPYASLSNQTNSHFQLAIQQLPTNRDTPQEKEAYRNWIKLFGTHYFTRGRFGGDIKYYIKVNSTLYQHETEEWVSFQVGLYVTYMDIKFGFNYGRNISRHNISERFWENVSSFCRFRPFGDELVDCENLTRMGFDNWVQAALNQPVLLAPNLMNISEIINDDKKRINMQEAVVDYLDNPNGTDITRYQSSDSSVMEALPPLPRRAPLPYIPGYNIIGMGLDAAKMDFSVLSIVPQNLTEKGPYTCTPNNQYGPGCWQNPFYPDKKFFIPADVYLENTPESNLVNGSQIFQSLDDWEYYYSKTTTKHSWFGSKSKSVYKFYQKYFEEDSALIFEYQSRSWYKLTMPPLPPPKLNPRVLEVLKTLPPKYDPNNENVVRLYRNAIESLGTHFIYSAKFGGVQQMTAWFHKCLVSEYSVDWVKEQSGWSFFGIIYSNHGKINYNEKLNANFVSWSTVLVDYTGGNAYEYEPDQFDDWVKTLKDRPVPTTYEVMPISDIIQDSGLSASYALAVKDYLADAHNVAVEVQKDFEKKDPWTKPPWCHWKPPGQWD